MTFRPIPAPPAPATVYGIVIDHLYAVNGQAGLMVSNHARRRRWTLGVYIYARPFTDNELATHGGDPLAHGVFVVYSDGSEEEYDSPVEDTKAADWVVRP